jgi:decaprenylphospho-beta-D-ribofuranose 2-oxidase
MRDPHRLRGEGLRHLSAAALSRGLPFPDHRIVRASPPADVVENGVERELTGWGRHARVRALERRGESLERISDGAQLSRGLGRAYGDAALPPAGSRGPLATTLLADRLISFDPTTGRLRAEAGTPLAQLNRVFLPRGWFTPVSPGTAFVTLGGMIAADIHGKNHHVAGTIGEHVSALRMRVADGRVLEVSDETEPDLFRATLGGMGLTGHILEVELTLERIPSPWISEERESAASIDELIPALAEASTRWPMTVAWLDTSARGAALGRGVLIKGRWATSDEAPAGPPPAGGIRLSLPFELPSGLANRHTLRLANSAWYALQISRRDHGISTPDAFFYPLDAIGEWNRAYGRRGFTQYQCVLPSDARVYRSFLELFQREGGSSFVTVIKDCGPEGRGLISFPTRGTSIGLDIPIPPGGVQPLIDALNGFTLEHGGRIYLAKDGFTRREHFRSMYPRFEQWNDVRRKWDPDGRLRSALSVRLFGDQA